MLFVEEVIIPDKFSDFIKVFMKESAAGLPKCFNINKHAIELEPGKLALYGPIYSLGPIELETLKTYIKTNLANSFIWPSKLPGKAPISFIRKLDSSLCLCINYCSLNNSTIKN